MVQTTPPPIVQVIQQHLHDQGYYTQHAYETYSNGETCYHVIYIGSTEFRLKLNELSGIYKHCIVTDGKTLSVYRQNPNNPPLKNPLGGASIIEQGWEEDEQEINLADPELLHKITKFYTHERPI